MAKIRKQTYSLDQYLKLMKAETIRSDQECQRRSGQWNSNMVLFVSLSEPKSSVFLQIK